MNDIKLYERIPKTKFPLYMNDYVLPQSVIPLHWHEHIEIDYVASGTLTVRIGDNLVHAQKGDCIIIKPTELHAMVSEDKCHIASSLLPPDFFDYKGLSFDTLVRDDFVSAEIEHIFELARDFEETRYLEIKGRMYLLLVHLIKNYSQDTFTETQYLPYSKKSERINNAIKYIAQNYTDNITTDFLARLSNTSNAYFCHIFKEITGKSAKEYITVLRVEKAAGLLETTAMNITEIAMQCGFSDANYFARSFKRIKGISPSQYRKKDTDNPR